jgi:hypothetical protein
MDIRKVKGGGIYGSAQVRLTKKTVLVSMDDKKNEHGAVIEHGREYEIERENAPKGIEAGHWSVALNTKGDVLFSYRPLSGTFSAKFLKFAAAKDAPPAPQSEPSTYRNKAGEVVNGDPQLKFTAIILVDDTYEYPVKLPYRYFQEDDKGNVTLEYGKLGNQVAKLIDFLDFCGVKDSVIPYTENILPDLEQMILDEDREFIVKVNKGWIDSFSPPLVVSKKKRKTTKKARKK